MNEGNFETKPTLTTNNESIPTSINADMKYIDRMHIYNLIAQNTSKKHAVTIAEPEAVMHFPVDQLGIYVDGHHIADISADEIDEVVYQPNQLRDVLRLQLKKFLE